MLVCCVTTGGIRHVAGSRCNGRFLWGGKSCGSNLHPLAMMQSGAGHSQSHPRHLNYAIANCRKRGCRPHCFLDLALDFQHRSFQGAGMSSQTLGGIVLGRIFGALLTLLRAAACSRLTATLRGCRRNPPVFCAAICSNWFMVSGLGSVWLERFGVFRCRNFSAPAVGLSPYRIPPPLGGGSGPSHGHPGLGPRYE